MMPRIWRLYLDTSVVGGIFEEKEGFAAPSRRVIDAIVRSQAILLYSTIVEEELVDALLRVRNVLDAIPPACCMIVPVSEDAVELSRAYITAGIIGEDSQADALHVAAATVARADAIVSWNFKHIVQLDRMKAYNQVNLAEGYGMLTIINPRGVNFDE